ncbi:MAG: hypothetical protein RL885_09370 [Planctomycetota bacterium]
MDDAYQNALDALDAAERACPRRIQPVELTPEYLEAVEALERRPSNAPGADKTWVHEAIDEALRHLASARRR